MPPTNHAARLREMAEEKRECDMYQHFPESPWYQPEVACERCKNTGQLENPDAAALLAGAEALEAVAKLRAFADVLTAQNTPVLHGMAYQIDRLLPEEEESGG
jgi:hypothetical protein